MILSTESIKQRINDGRIVYELGDLSRIQQCSVDLLVGQFLWIPVYHIEKIPAFKRKEYDVRCINKVERFGKEFWLFDLTEPMMLYPSIMYLLHTQEFIGTSAESGLCMEMKLKSTPTRWGSDHSLSAHYDPGYHNRGTLEISVFEPLEIQWGSCIVQALFHEVKEQPWEILDYAKVDNYQTDKDLKELIKSWNPEMMLPNKEIVVYEINKGN